jgi:hypothetical protein
MDKLEIELKARETKNFLFGSQNVQVKPYISSQDQLILIGIYLKELFGKVEDSEYNHSRAENSLIAYILDKQTNIKLYNDEENEAIVTMDNIFEHYDDLWEKVEKSIVNLSDVKRRIFRSVEERKEQIRLETSLPSTIRNISDRVLEFLESLKDLDLSDEGLAKLKETAKEITDSPIIREAVDIFKNQSPKTE